VEKKCLCHSNSGTGSDSVEYLLSSVELEVLSE
jgi:hypothetical protein